MNLSALGGFSVELRGSPFLFVILILLILFWAVFAYRRTVPPVKPGLKILLALLRFSSVAVLLFLIFEPTISYQERRERKPLLPVLIDDTQSMGLKDPSGARTDQLQKVFADPAWNKLGKRFDLVFFAFDDSVRKLDELSFDRLRLNAVGTDLSAARQSLVEEFKGESPSACIVISDGGDNRGRDPIESAGRAGFPIYTIGIGDTATVRDAAIASITGEPVAYVGKPAQLVVRVRAKKMENQSARIELTDEDKRLIASREIRLPGDNLLTETTLEFTPEKPGDTVLRIRLTTSGEEQSTDNNLRVFPVMVHPSRIRVLTVSGYPGFESMFFQRAASDLSDLEITAIDLEGAKRESAAKRINFQEILTKTDVMILIHPPKSQKGRAALERLSRALEKHPLPVWIWLGRESPTGVLEKLCGALPMKFIPARLSGSGEAVPDRFYSVLDPDAEFEEAELWDDLPPLQYAPFRIEIQPPAQSLIQLKDPETGQSVTPVLIGWRQDGRRCALSIGSGYWRWSFLNQGLTGGAELYSGLIFRMLRWLNEKAVRKPLQLTTDKALYSSGERVHFNARVFAGDGSPVKSAQVEVNLEGPEGSTKLLLEPDAFGRYSGSFVPEGVGTYRYFGEAVVDGESAGADSGNFNVEAYNVEKETLRQNRELLQAIARESGGVYLPADSIQTLADTLSAPPRIVMEGWSRRFFLNWDIFCVLMGLLSLEWLIRKRSGVL
jgi:hypothetical protein